MLTANEYVEIINDLEAMKRERRAKMLTTTEYVEIVNELEEQMEIARQIAREYEKLSEPIKRSYHLGIADGFEMALMIVKGE